MTFKISKPTPLFLPYQKVLPEGFICPQPEYLREDMLQAEPNDESGHLLRDHFSGQPGTLVDTGGFVFYDPSDLKRHRVRPDVYIVFGVDRASVLERQGYVIAEAGKPPDFALEIASPTTYRADMRRKPAQYARIGISEYWRFDPTGGELYGYPLAGDILVDGAYQSIELTLEEGGMLWGYSPVLDLCLCARDRRLLYYDRKTGSYLHSIGEERAAHHQTAAQRDAERNARLTSEAQRDQAAAQRDAERNARLTSEAQRDQAAAQRDAERNARLTSEAQRDVAQLEVERLREELRRLQGQ